MFSLFAWLLACMYVFCFITLKEKVACDYKALVLHYTIITGTYFFLLFFQDDSCMLINENKTLLMLLNV